MIKLTLSAETPQELQNLLTEMAFNVATQIKEGKEITFESLDWYQNEHAVWEEYNFPESHSYAPLLGLSEEVGELAEEWVLKDIHEPAALDTRFIHIYEQIKLVHLVGVMSHSLLKLTQGIRGNKKDHQRIYLQAVFAIEGLLKRGYPESMKDIFHQEKLQPLTIKVRKSDKAKVKDGIGDTLLYLMSYSRSLGLRVSDCLKEAWNEIKDRDWKKYPTNGKDL